MTARPARRDERSAHSARYPLVEALRLSGLGEARFRYLEREFGMYIGLVNPLFMPSVYSLRQIALLRKINDILCREELTLQAVKERIACYLSLRREGMWIAAVTSGKGGVGKTTMAVNLSVAMARLGTRPTLVDADLGLANAHLLLGVLPERTIGDIVRGEASLEEVLVRTPYGLTLVPGGSGATELANLGEGGREELAGEIRKLYYHADALIIDTGSGISENVLRFLRLADDIIVVVTPNIASGVDALGVIQAVEEEGCPGKINVLVNRCKDEMEAREVFLRLHRALAGMTRNALWYLGHVPEDPHLEESFQKGIPVTSLFSGCRASRQIRHIAQAVMKDRTRVDVPRDDKVMRLFSGLAAR